MGIRRSKVVCGVGVAVLFGSGLPVVTSGDAWNSLYRLDAGTEVRVGVVAENGQTATIRSIEGSFVVVNESELVVDVDRESFGRIEDRPDGTMTVTLSPGLQFAARETPGNGRTIEIVVAKTSIMSVAARTGRTRTARGAVIGGLVGIGVGCGILDGLCTFTGPVGAVVGAAWGAGQRTWERIYTRDGL